MLCQHSVAGPSSPGAVHFIGLMWQPALPQHAHGSAVRLISTGLLLPVVMRWSGLTSPGVAAMRLTPSCRDPPRLCLRFTPVELVCHADLDSLKRAAARLLPPHFPGGVDAAPVSFAVRAPRGRGRAGARCAGTSAMHHGTGHGWCLRLLAQHMTPTLSCLRGRSAMQTPPPPSPTLVPVQAVYERGSARRPRRCSTSTGRV